LAEARARTQAQILEDSARSDQFKDVQLNQRATEAIGTWQTLQQEKIGLTKKVVFKVYFSLSWIMAFGVAVYWSTRVDKEARRQAGWSEIMHRFPKFIPGFIRASLLFSVLLEVLSAGESRILVEQGILRGFSVEVRDWLFCLAFAGIGLSSNFAGLRHQMSDGKPLLLYVCGQMFNLWLTLLMAWLMFYVVFTDITSRS
jgi:uncharacterized membrane protein YadS